MTGCRARVVSFVLLLLGGSASRATATQPFTEEAAARGVNYSAAFLDTGMVGMAGGSHGACFADLDQDGNPDLVLVGRADQTVGVFENDGAGQFTERTGTGMPLLAKASSISAGDFDADGDLDLFLPQIVYDGGDGFAGAHYLMRNDGNFTFTDVAGPAGILPGGSTTGTTWGDYDGDGYLDLYVGNYSWSATPINNRLYHNQGDGTFEDVAVALGVDDSDLPGDAETLGGFAFQASFLDYDLDGDVDLYFVNDRGAITNNPNRLWKNLGDGTFQDVSTSAGLDYEMFSMGIGYGDIDRNGWSDFYVTNIQFNKLWLQNADHTFIEQAVPYGVFVDSVSWGTLMEDFNNDGWLDVWVCNTPQGAQGNNLPRLFISDGTPPLVDMAAALGLNLTSGSYGIASADIDDDGDLDTAVVAPYSPVQLYINHSENEPEQHWLKVRLRGSGNNRLAVGATVLVTDAIGQQQRSVVAGWSYKSQSDATLHFGVGAAISLSEVRVLWPGGATCTLNNVAANQTLVIDQTPPAVATSPFPASGASTVSLDADLTWGGAPGTSYQVYFGQTNPPPFLAATATPAVVLTPLSPQTNYYWRVDTFGCPTTTGPVWTFSTTVSCTAPSAASAPYPAHAAAAVDADDDLAWSGATGASFKVYFGTASSPPFLADSNTPNVALPALEPETTYYWRVDTMGCATVAGTVWSFVTAASGTPLPGVASVAIAAPTAAATHAATSPTITISGTTSGTGITKVEWATSASASGPCTSSNGWATWSAANVPLAAGSTTITVTATLTGGDITTDQLLVSYVPPTIPPTSDDAPPVPPPPPDVDDDLPTLADRPVVAIVSPTRNVTYETDGATIALGGTASDRTVYVWWSNDRGGSGSGIGARTWLAEGVPLQPGENLVIVTAVDDAGHSGSDALLVFLTAGPTGTDAPPPGAPVADPPIEELLPPDAGEPNGSADDTTSRPSASTPATRAAPCGVGLAWLLLPLLVRLRLARQSVLSPPIPLHRSSAKSACRPSSPRL